MGQCGSSQPAVVEMPVCSNPPISPIFCGAVYGRSASGSFDAMEAPPLEGPPEPPTEQEEMKTEEGEPTTADKQRWKREFFGTNRAESPATVTTNDASPPLSFASLSTASPSASFTGSFRNGSTGHKSMDELLLSSGRTSSLRGRRSKNDLIRIDSKVGLNQIIDIKKEEGDLKNNMVHIEVPLGKPIEEVYEGVHDGPILGSGVSGFVRLIKHRATQVNYAAKCLDLGHLESEEGLRQLKEEIYTMCQLDHPNIIRLEEVYESHSTIYLVQEVCTGGELYDLLDEQPDYHYTEAQCARLVKQMLSSVRYIHDKGIIHRDLKLQNFLFSNKQADSELKMIDFGLSKHFKLGDVQHQAVGTPYTVAPEIIRGNYDERCDVWAIGVITYLLLSGDAPFGGCGEETLMEVRKNILRGDFEFEPKYIWDDVSSEAKKFIQSLLVVDPTNRPTAKQAQTLPWLKIWADRENVVSDKKINPNVINSLVNFKEYSDIRKLLCEVLSFTLLPEQIQDLRKEFEMFDTEGTGEISLSALKKVLIGNAATGSLGGLTEEEVEDIFNAMRVRKSETTIHWHDFIAAGLSQCKVDDRNLRLAFERLDAEHKGFVDFENVMDLMGHESFEREDAMLKMWGDSMEDVDCKTALISYEDFVLLMKGQKKKVGGNEKRRNSVDGLHTVLGVVEEVISAGETKDDIDILTKTSIEIHLDSSALDSRDPCLSPIMMEETNLIRQGSISAPSTPLRYGKRLQPEHTHNQADLDKVLKNESGSPLVVNRKLYRAHREFRQAVVDACKRFDDEQMRRASKELRTQEMEKGRRTAGLVMRHGHRKILMSSSFQ